MKNIFILGLILASNICLSQTKNESILLEKIENIEHAINKILDDNTKSQKIDSLSISVKELVSVSKEIDTKSDNITPSLIALLVVLISTGGALFIGVRQIKTQTENAEEQIKSQEAQAQDNLKIAREQIQETSKMTLAQVRANNISQARINWMQDFRNEITFFNGEVALINFFLREVLELTEKKEEPQAEKLYNEQIKRIKNARQSAFKVKLFLNPQESNHEKLEELIQKYSKSALENYESVNSDFNDLSNNILNVSRDILKEVWEQAKNEGK